MSITMNINNIQFKKKRLKVDASPARRLAETAAFLEARGITTAKGPNPIWFNGALVGAGSPYSKFFSRSIRQLQ